ncbi:MAG: hypothetical protein NTX25_13835 [Proteobacteria bacterium]|nr:hypothetical protein [Pseudomonadota bacterium]
MMKRADLVLRGAIPSIVVLFFASMMSTCVHKLLTTDKEPAISPVELPSEPQLEIIKEPMAPAVQSLLKKASLALQEKRIGDAEAHAERAYRMESRDYRVLILQAQIAFARAKANDAEQWALRALESLPPRYPAHRREAWLLVAACRKAQSKTQAAIDAEREAAKL